MNSDSSGSFYVAVMILFLQSEWDEGMTIVKEVSFLDELLWGGTETETTAYSTYSFQWNVMSQSCPHTHYDVCLCEHRTQQDLVSVAAAKWSIIIISHYPECMHPKCIVHKIDMCGTFGDICFCLHNA